MPTETQQPPTHEEPEKPVRDGDETNGNGHSGEAEAPPVPEITPNPLGPGGTVPLPGIKGRSRKPPVINKIVVTQAACPGAGQLDPEREYLLIVRAGYLKGGHVPKFDGEGRVREYDYIQTLRPTWTEDLDTFLDANGYKIVRADDEGEAVSPGNLVDIEELREAKESPLD